jgi:hypothetical protein
MLAIANYWTPGKLKLKVTLYQTLLLFNIGEMGHLKNFLYYLFTCKWTDHRTYTSFHKGPNHRMINQLCHQTQGSFLDMGKIDKIKMPQEKAATDQKGL